MSDPTTDGASSAGAQPDGAPPPRPALLFDHNVIEHLGIKLYQNKPSNVLAELVANSWDADAKHVWVDVREAAPGQDAYIAVADDGSGMTLPTINERYLVIGKAKRANPKDRSDGGRPPMGRKGIGKLAPFGIAGRVDVATFADGKLNWFTLELPGLKKAGATGRYEPDFPAEDVDAAADPVGGDPAIRAKVAEFLAKVRPVGHGTLVLMTQLTPNALPDRAATVSGLSRRFTVILARPDFEVHVDGAKIEEAEALPEFELRIPPEPGATVTEKIDGKDVRFWAGFFEKAGPTTDEAGVGVFVHGKIAQDRPFFFKSTGKEVFQRYLYAVVEADWLDELDEDLVSTDRTSIDWDAAAAQDLAAWGKDKVSKWLDAYTKHRAGKHGKETRTTAGALRDAKKIPVFSAAENEAVDQLVADATRDLPKSEVEKARGDLLLAVSKAWTNLPARKLIKEVWEDFVKAGAAPEQLAAFVLRLDQHAVPEAMNLALTFAQRAYALTMLQELKNRTSETRLQKLIEVFPWILQPRGELLTANQQLKTSVEKAADLLDDKTWRIGRIIKGMTEAERADVVFLTSVDERTIEVVELKSPWQPELNAENDRQLSDYLHFVQANHPDAAVTGLLVGNPGAPAFRTTDTRTTVKSWNEVFREGQAAYVDMLAAMLTRAEPEADDSRIELVQRFAGDEVWGLLRKIAENDGRLRATMDKLDHLLEPAAALPAPAKGLPAPSKDG
ncbi:ATP-binding protein [Sphingomonas sp. BT-65]|uniref:ATP-binding protein n=1 Tax=Sphingomonas sp. BT-65 TaxID=2989821 RepID=UPI0022363248|nr:ATP-binding protein [Sphingomonas sp. BT-65]MCW4460823.1 ATP-binding protein [Sphingomonas sp. BT-65]